MEKEEKTGKSITSYIGQIPSHEMGILSDAAKELGASFETIGVQTDFTHPRLPDQKITVTQGNEGVILTTNPDIDPSDIWKIFFRIKDSS